MLVLLLAYCLMSILWSDATFISAKRWFRDLGNYLVVIVVLTELQPIAAIRAVLRRYCYIVVSLSITLIKYFPDVSRQYNPWDGIVFFTGAATSKNTLGLLCLVAGLFFFWDTARRWIGNDADASRTRATITNVVFFGLTIWTLNQASSATSQVCLAVGCVIIFAGYVAPRATRVFIPVAMAGYAFLDFVLGIELVDVVASWVGRDPSLTDRTFIWDVLLGINTDPWVGVGYEAFWLNPRLEVIWNSGFGRINEAHNGYLQVYLNLGMIGVALLVAFLIASYVKIQRRMLDSDEPASELARLAIAIWSVLVFYNVTEAAFLGGILWVTLLLTIPMYVRPVGLLSPLRANRPGATT